MSIPYIPQDYQTQIEDHPARFKVVIIGRRGGKTETAIHITVDKAMKSPGLYWIIAPTYRQVKSIIWTRLKQVLKNDPFWKFNEQELSAEHQIVNTKIELRGADNPDMLKGVGLNGVVLDECALIKQDAWTEVIRPMLADKKGWALFITTPKGRNWVYDLYIKGLGEDQSWKSWHFPTSVNKYIAPEEIAQSKKDISERLFRQEFLAEFLDDETGVFKRVKTCITGSLEESKTGRFYVIGVDLAKTEDFTVLTVIDSVTRSVVAFERFQDVSWREQKIRIQALARRYNNALCLVDSTGVGDPILEELQHSGVSCEGFKFSNESKTRLIEQLQIAIEQRCITFPLIEELIQELMNYEYSITDHGRITYSAPSGKHDDCVISLALAVWGIRAHLHEAQVVQASIEAQEEDRQGRGELVVQDVYETHYSGY